MDATQMLLPIVGQVVEQVDGYRSWLREHAPANPVMRHVEAVLTAQAKRCFVHAYVAEFGRKSVKRAILTWKQINKVNRS